MCRTLESLRGVAQPLVVLSEREVLGLVVGELGLEVRDVGGVGVVHRLQLVRHLLLVPP